MYQITRHQIPENRNLSDDYVLLVCGMACTQSIVFKGLDASTYHTITDISLCLYGGNATHRATASRISQE
jgi:hypothetical protein